MSTVVLSNVPYTCQEPDIHRALLMYGTAVNIQLNLATAQAVVTMRTIEEAQAVLNRHSLSLLGSNVRVDSLAAATPPQHQGHHHHHHQHSNMGMPPNSGAHSQMPPQHIFPSHHHHQQHQGFPGNPPTMPTNRLRVVIEDCQYPINKDILVQMFSMVAPPTFVHCGPSRPTTFGSVEFPDIASAERAMAQFSNKSIYPNTCFLKLSYDAAPHTSQPPGIQHANGHGYGASNFHRQDYASMPGNAPGMMGGRGGARGAPRGVGGGAGRGGSSYGSMSAAYDSLASHHNTQDGRPPGRQPPEDATVIVSNVAETVPLYDLWVLLEVYGNVNSLRRQFRDVTNVVAQFQNIADARTAVMYLQHCPFRGKELSLKQFSGYVERSGSVDWNVGPATDAATRAVTFASGFHHRTKPSAPYNPLGRIRPDKNLFISNLTEAITNEELQKEFQDAGCEIVGYYRKDPSVAIVSLKDTDAAIDAIIAKHGKQVKERYLRVTFSRYPPGPPPTAEPCAPHAVATPAGDTAGEAAEVQPPTTTEAPNEEITSTEVVAPVEP